MSEKVEQNIINDTVYKSTLKRQKEMNWNGNDIIPMFLNEIKSLGYEFELSIQAREICRINPKEFRLIIMKYYKIAKLENEKAYLMSCFNSKKNNEMVPFFINEFYCNNNSIVRSAIGNCLISTSNIKYLNDYVKMIKDSHLGVDRAYIILTVKKLKNKAIVDALIEILSDSDLRLDSLQVLKSYKDKALYSVFNEYINDNDPEVRKEAKKAIALMDNLK